MNRIELEIASLIAAALGVPQESVTREASFAEDLGAESLDSVALIMAIEDHFDIDIPDEDAEQIRTVRQLIECVLFESAADEARRGRAARSSHSQALR
jgi:acyl carrier protein